jgi:hypothetical protein
MPPGASCAALATGGVFRFVILDDAGHAVSHLALGAQPVNTGATLPGSFVNHFSRHKTSLPGYLCGYGSFLQFPLLLPLRFMPHKYVTVDQ